MRKRGFTIIELAVVIVFATLLVVLFFVQKINTDAMHRDEQRKEAIKQDLKKRPKGKRLLRKEDELIKIANQLEGYSYSSIANIARKAVIWWVANRAKLLDELNNDDVNSAIAMRIPNDISL